MKEKPAPEIYGLIGYPVKHSLSKVMQEAAFKELGIPAEYKLFEVRPEDLEGFLLGNKEICDIEGKTFTINDLSGFNITIPHKIKAREILEKKFPLVADSFVEQDLYYVKLSNAINTVKIDNGKLKYWNTDSWGFIRALEEDLKVAVKGKKVLIVGCGGAGRAVIAALSWKDARLNKIYVNDISEEAIESAEKHFKSLPQYPGYLDKLLQFVQRKDIEGVMKDCDLLINASPIGMKDGDPSIVDSSWLHQQLSVYDVVYNRETQLVKDAKEILGPSKVCGGLGMLLYQGVAAFEFWTKQGAPVEIMRKALLKAVSGKPY